MKTAHRTGFFAPVFKFIVPVCIGVLLGLLIATLCYHYTFQIIDTSKKYGVWEVFNSIISLFGVIGTFLAVIIALFKDSILERIYHPKFKIDFLQDDGFMEILQAGDSETPVANMYSSRLRMLNVGKVTARQCRLCLNSIFYASEHEDSKQKSIVEGIKKRSSISWEAGMSDDTTILPNQAKDVELFTIVPDGDRQGAKVFFCGIQMMDMKYRTKGYWKLEYIFCYGEGSNPVTIRVKFWWSGKWRNRKAEMSDEVSISMDVQ